MLDRAQIVYVSPQEAAARRRAMHARTAALAVPDDQAVNARARAAAELAAAKRALIARKAMESKASAVAAQKALEAEERLAYIEPRRVDVMAMIANGLPQKPRVSEIQRVVAEHYGVTRDDIISQRRTADVVRPRQVAMYLSTILTACSLPDLGRRFGGRDHTTVLHAERKIAAMMDGGTSPRFSRGYYASGRIKSFSPDHNFRAKVELIATDIVLRMMAAKERDRANVGKLLEVAR